MLRYLKKENKKLGYEYKNYYLTQGDSFTLKATESGSPSIDGQIVSGVKFKLGVKKSDCVFEQVFEQAFIKNETEPVWFLKVSGETTKDWKTTCECNEEPYVYEIELEYSDGEPVTLTSGNFIIEPQIRGANE